VQRARTAADVVRAASASVVEVARHEETVLNPTPSREALSLRPNRLLIVLAAAVLASVSLNAMAQEWPARPIRIVIGQAAGGAPDILSRILAQRLTEDLGQPVIVDLKPGSGGIVAADSVAKAPADGYSLLLATTTNLAVTPYLKRSLPYDTFRDFEPVSLIAMSANVLVVGKHVPAASMSELLQLARDKPGQLNFGSAGLGTPAHLGGELLCVLGDVKMVHVPYKGAAQALNDVVGGQIQIMITSPLSARVFLKDERVRALATTGAAPDPLLPQLPTVSQTLPGYEISQWWGIVVRSGTPRPIVDRLHAALTRALREPRVKELFLQQGVEARPTRIEEFAALIARERDRYSDLIKRTGIPTED
jgi:tripartite-type tricarboxylate transporter receptor subunit TctC